MWWERRKQLTFMRNTFKSFICDALKRRESPGFAIEVILENVDRFLRFGPGHLTHREACVLSLAGSYLKKRFKEEIYREGIPKEREEYQQRLIENFVRYFEDHKVMHLVKGK